MKFDAVKGRKRLTETNPDLVRGALRPYPANPVTGERKSYQWVKMSFLSWAK